MSQLHFSDPVIEQIPAAAFKSSALQAYVLRLDKIHPVISGNKWYKLKEYLTDVTNSFKKVIVTFGGAFSNHIVATAAACRHHSLISVGIIRGEEPKVYSPTLLQAQEYGMKLFFISREDYSQKKVPPNLLDNYKQEDQYIINEGGYGTKGAEGIADIVKKFNTEGFTHILAAVGTGTTLAGIVMAASSEQSIIGISALKNHTQLESEVSALVPMPNQHFSILHQYHFGGYAKKTKELIHFMNEWFMLTGIPSDFVYTGKLFYAFTDLCTQQFFKPGSKVLLIHSGGLQGNRSLPAGTLIF